MILIIAVSILSMVHAIAPPFRGDGQLNMKPTISSLPRPSRTHTTSLRPLLSSPPRSAGFFAGFLPQTPAPKKTGSWEASVKTKRNVCQGGVPVAEVAPDYVVRPDGTGTCAAERCNSYERYGKKHGSGIERFCGVHTEMGMINPSARQRRLGVRNPRLRL